MLREPSLRAIWIYRFGQRVDRGPDGLLRKLVLAAYHVLAPIIHVIYGVRIHGCRIGKGLRIWHFGGIFFNENSVIGENSTLRRGARLGIGITAMGRRRWERMSRWGLRQILGNVRIGNKCRTGALTLVIEDMPDGSIAAGQKARTPEPR